MSLQRAALRWSRVAVGAEAAAFVPFEPKLALATDQMAEEEAAHLFDEAGRAELSAGRTISRRARAGEHGGRGVWRFEPVKHAQGPPLGALCVLFADEGRLDDRARAELAELADLLADQLTCEAERAEQAEFSQFFRLTLDHVCVADFNGNFKLLNRSWEKTLGYTLEELYARPFVEFVHPDDREATAREAEAISKGRDTVTFQNRYRCKDGSYRFMHWTATSSLERERIYAIARDVTEQKRFEEELERSKEAAEAASHAKSIFLATMSHELRTPLNSVIGFSNLLLKNREGHLSREELNYLERILANGRDLLDLIDSILDLSKIEAGGADLPLADVDVSRLACQTVASLQVLAAGKAVRLLVDGPKRPVVVRTNELKLRQILLNLLMNGLKFTERGSVTLRIVMDASGERLASLEVVDTGPGIPGDRLEAIFEPFIQLDNSAARRYGGTGLGLAICRSLAQALKIKLEVESVVGQGSTFRLVFGVG